MNFICMVLILFLFIPSLNAKTTFPDQETCTFQVFRTDVPDIKENYSIQIVPKGIEIENNEVEIIYNGQRKGVVCNNRWRNLGNSDEFPEMFKCRVDRTGNIMPNTSIIASMKVINPYTYRNVHNNEPALDYPTLDGTSQSNPFCDSDEYSRECKWQTQNLNDPDLTAKGVPLNKWVVYSETEVTDFKIGFTVDNSILKHGDIVCGEDIIKDGRVTDESEFTFCVPGRPTYLCPRDAIKCYDEMPAGCITGQLDTTIDKCVESIKCPEPGSFSQTLKLCVSALEEECDTSEPPVCSMVCPSGYSLFKHSNGTEDCINRRPFCDPGSMVRPSNYNWYCYISNPICLKGGIYNEEDNCCYPPGYPCPYGEKFECIRATGYAKKMCSKFPCNQVEKQGSPEGSLDKENDGKIDSNGNCEGTIYIFNGSDRRCRDGGLKLAWDSCCKNKDYFVGLMNCRNSEQELAELKSKDLCHEIGLYCSKKIRFIGGSTCVEQSKSYCCFNSRLAKIIHEQGRPQLKTFAGATWGTGKRPECRGFTPDEFQNLDFSKIDLSEWYDEIEVMSQTQITDSITSGVTQFHDKIH